MLPADVPYCVVFRVQPEQLGGELEQFRGGFVVVCDVCPDLVVEVAVFLDLFELLLPLFFSAGAVGSGYAMLISFASVKSISRNCC